MDISEAKRMGKIMKFFHLADLHLGKTIHGCSMIEMGDQPFLIEQLLKKVSELCPDAVLISGDIYDRAVPSKDAVILLDHFLTKLSEMGVSVMIIAGNHDSGSRLAFADRLLSHQGIYIAGEAKREITKVTLFDIDGPVNFWLIPYIFPAQVNVILGVEDFKDYDSAMRALLEIQNIDFAERNVIVAHQFVTAGGEKPSMGGSETTVGGIGQIDAQVFSKFDYTALGHIHNAQAMGLPSVRYAGSPICYHFGEANQKKGLTVVEIGRKGEVRISLEPLEVLHEMKEISGTLEEIKEQCLEMKSCYVRAVLKQTEIAPHSVETLREFFGSRNCVLMEIVRDSGFLRKNAKRKNVTDVRKMSLEELFSDFYQSMHDGEFPESGLEALVSYAAEQTRNGREDDTEKEKVQDRKKLIDFAGRGCCGK